VNVFRGGNTGATGITGTLQVRSDNYQPYPQGTGITGFTGTTGTYLIHTVDPFKAFVAASFDVVIAGSGQSPAGVIVQQGTPLQAADNSWWVPFTVFNSSDSPADLGSGNSIGVILYFRNSDVLP
jgi:hypothetical protein